MAQSLSENVELESQIESLIFTNIANDKELDSSVDDLVDNLKCQVDLNQANGEVLAQLFILSPVQIKSILDYRKRVGRFKSVYELQFIYTLDRETLNKLQRFVYVEDLSTNTVDKSGFTKFYIKHELSSRVGIPLFKRAGDNTQFMGPPIYNNIRYRCQLNKNIEFGLVGEKDAGEPFLALKNRCGYDHYSYYILLKNIYNIKTICLGLFRVSFGMGLTVGTTSFGGKWSALQTFFKGGTIVQKHGSVSESNYFRGLASIYNIKKFELASFISYTGSDGIIKDEEITSLLKTGFHRTSKELGNKNRVKQLTFGQRISYIKDDFELGVNGVFYQFNYPLSKSDLNYKKYDIRGNKFFNFSLDYALYLHKVLLKGEVAKGKRGIVFLHKIYYSPHPSWDILLIHRLYSYDYWGYLASAFGNQSAVKNENGWYINVQSSLFSPLVINFYLDICSYPWHRYRVSHASKSLDIGLALDYTIGQNQKISLKTSYKSVTRDFSRPSSKPKTQVSIQHYKIHTVYNLGIIENLLGSKTMVDYSGVKTPKYESGYALTQRFTYSPSFLSCSLQYSYFRTPSFDTRIYIYEKNLLYNPSISSFNGCGHRCSCLFNCRINKAISFSLKYGITYYLDRDFIGSGLDKIAGCHKSDLSIMGRFKF